MEEVKILSYFVKKKKKKQLVKWLLNVDSISLALLNAKQDLKT